MAQERGEKKVAPVSEFFIPYAIYGRMKHVYTWVEEGQITYMVYMLCSGENYMCLWVFNW